MYFWVLSEKCSVWTKKVVLLIEFNIYKDGDPIHFFHDYLELAYLIGVAGSFLPLPSGLVIVGGSLDGDTDAVLPSRQDAAEGRREGEHPLTLTPSDIWDKSGERLFRELTSRTDLLRRGLCVIGWVRILWLPPLVVEPLTLPSQEALFPDGRFEGTPCL